MVTMNPEILDKKTKETGKYVPLFEAFEKTEGKRGAAWIRKLRQNAFAHFCHSGFPTQREEDWRYTSVGPIERTPFHLASETLPHITVQQVERLRPCTLNWNRLVFVNGFFCREFSHVSDAFEDLNIGSVREAIVSKSNQLASYLAQYVRYDQNGFTALNTAFIQDGAFVYVPEGKVLERPLELVFISTSRETVSGTVLAQPRNLIVVGPSSRATIVESYVSIDQETYCNNVVTEIILEESASLEYLRLQKESGRAYHVSTTKVNQAKDSVFSSTCVDLGGILVRNDLHVDLQEEGAKCFLNGLYLTSNEQHVDNHTLINHPRPKGTSQQLYKGILDGRSTAVFSGKIFVHQDAQKTDAHQTNKNLLLSEEATADTKPQLEIYADDVKCTHGAAVGQLDKDSLFYLKSRGIGENEARNILSYAFANEVAQRIKIPSIRAQLNDLLTERYGHRSAGEGVHHGSA